MRPGSVPREPEVLLAEERAKQAVVAPASILEPIEHVENLVIPGPAGDLPVRLYTPEGSGRSRFCCSFKKAGAGAIWTLTRSCAGVCVVEQASWC